MHFDCGQSSLNDFLQRYALAAQLRDALFRTAAAADIAGIRAIVGY